jgi:hypothetical protein
VDPKRLKYYIHDHVGLFRLQLLGSLTAIDLPELDGCWRTAQSSVSGRSVQLDIRFLDAVDAAGQQWLAEMAITNTLEFLASSESAHFLPPGTNADVVNDTACQTPGNWAGQAAKFLAIRLGRRLPESSTEEARDMALKLKAATTEAPASRRNREAMNEPPSPVSVS